MTLILFENTFVTLAEAENYFSGRPNSGLWNNLSNSEKEQALQFATLKINCLPFVGYKLSENQPLEFPRNFSPQMPNEIKYAVCEEALSVIENSVHSQNKMLGIASMTVGSSSVSYTNSESVNVIVSNQANAFLSKWLSKNFNMN